MADIAEELAGAEVSTRLSVEGEHRQGQALHPNGRSLPDDLLEAADRRRPSQGTEVQADR
jgi:hypothetical protein